MHLIGDEDQDVLQALWKSAPRIFDEIQRLFSNIIAEGTSTPAPGQSGPHAVRTSFGHISTHCTLGDNAIGGFPDRALVG